jgi:hypothetical protein
MVIHAFTSILHRLIAAAKQHSYNTATDDFSAAYVLKCYRFLGRKPQRIFYDLTKISVRAVESKKLEVEAT